jgi:hypothetical protein
MPPPVKAITADKGGNSSGPVRAGRAAPGTRHGKAASLPAL